MRRITQTFIKPAIAALEQEQTTDAEPTVPVTDASAEVEKKEEAAEATPAEASPEVIEAAVAVAEPASVAAETALTTVAEVAVAAVGTGEVSVADVTAVVAAAIDPAAVVPDATPAPEATPAESEAKPAEPAKEGEEKPADPAPTVDTVDSGAAIVATESADGVPALTDVTTTVEVAGLPGTVDTDVKEGVAKADETPAAPAALPPAENPSEATEVKPADPTPVAAVVVATESDDVPLVVEADPTVAVPADVAPAAVVPAATPVAEPVVIVAEPVAAADVVAADAAPGVTVEAPVADPVVVIAEPAPVAEVTPTPATESADPAPEATPAEPAATEPVVEPTPAPAEATPAEAAPVTNVPEVAPVAPAEAAPVVEPGTTAVEPTVAIPEAAVATPAATDPVAAVPAAPETLPELDLPSNADSLETALIEVTEQTAAADVIEAQVDEAVEVVEALEGIADILRTALEGQGLDKNGAAVLTIATEHMYERLGFKHEPSVSLESFGGHSSRHGATKIALEAAEGRIARIWELIIDAIKRSIAWVVERYTVILNVAGKMEKRAEELAKRLAKMDPSAPAREIDNARLVQALRVGSSVPANLTVKAEGLAEVADRLLGGFKIQLKVAELCAEVIDEGNPVKIKELGGFLDKNAALTALSNPGADGIDVPEGAAVARGVEMFGGKAIVQFYPASKSLDLMGDDAKLLSNFNTVLTDFKPNFSGKVAESMPGLKNRDAIEVAKVVESIAKTIQSYKAELDDLAKLKKRIVAGAQAAAKANDASADGKQKAFYQQLGRAIPKLLDEPHVSFSAYALTTCKALLDVVEDAATVKKEVKAAEPVAAAA